jgi:hypothetical protein
MAKQVPTEKPLLFGYHSARGGLPPEQLLNARDSLTAFAPCEGYALAGMFVEPSEEPAVALQAMIESAQLRTSRRCCVGYDGSRHRPDHATSHSSAP